MTPEEERLIKSFGVSRETIEKLGVFDGLLRKWQSRMNLVAPSTLNSIWMRHFADSLQLLSVVGDPSGTWIDMGSGAGFPGLPIAIDFSTTKSGSVHLIERDHRKCAFLRQVAHATNAAATVYHGSIEDFAISVDGPKFITSRAVAPLNQLVEWSASFLKAGAVGVFLKGRQDRDDLDRQSLVKTFNIESIPSKTDATSRVVLVRARSDVGY